MVTINRILFAYACFFTMYTLALQMPNLNPLLIIGCFILYLISVLYIWTLSKYRDEDNRRKKTKVITTVYALVYIGAALAIGSFDQAPFFSALTLSGSFLHFTAAIVLIRSASSAKPERMDRLKEVEPPPPALDSLTGLCNYEEYHRRLEELVVQQQPLFLILIDCNDLKSMNTSHGFQAGNLILKQMAELLKILFSDALFLSRCGGDEFAVVLPAKDQDPGTATYKLQLDSELPKLVGIQITYGAASFPREAQTKDELILLAEHNLFMKKREMWLKREEHMLRSEKLRVVGELASGMAHEIRNPLTTIKGFLQLSRASGYNIENWYSMIMDEIERMSDLTGEFLQFSKPHSTQFLALSLHDCICKVISLTESEATRLGHVIHYEHPEEHFLVVMDQDKMIQMLLNLVKNAYEAMEENGLIQIKLSRDHKNATLIVEDNGPGISSELLETIFHPFYTTKENGTGLGLSICHKIVQDHQGTLEVESQIQLGTRFIITLPLASEESVL